ncbi:MAG TPA: hypothetical protein VME92_21725 [Acetobacteraceae bacterium]|nr:hypothetical protein [Acetobacteraceae bacterium]
MTLDSRHRPSCLAGALTVPCLEGRRDHLTVALQAKAFAWVGWRHDEATAE